MLPHLNASPYRKNLPANNSPQGIDGTSQFEPTYSTTHSEAAKGVQTNPGQEGTPDPEALDPILPRKRQPPSRGPAPVTKRYGFLLNVFFRPADSFKRTAMKLCIILFSNQFFNCHFRWSPLHLCLAYDCVCTSCPIEVTGSFCIFL